MTIRWNGRNAEDAFNKAALPQLREDLAKLLRKTKCPEHGTPPASVTVTGDDLGLLEMHTEGVCCLKLTEAMRQKMGTPSR
jgi:hypothetical protein